MNQKESQRGLSTRHDLKPNITTERAFRRRLPGRKASGAEGGEATPGMGMSPLSRADMSATVYYRERRYVGRGG